MLEDTVDDGRVFDAGDDPERPATVAAGLDVDAEHALEALRPRHGRTALGRCFAGVVAGAPATTPGRDLRAQGAVRSKHPVEAGEVHTRFRHQRNQAGDEIQRFEDDVRGAVTVRCLEPVADIALAGQGRVPYQTSGKATSG